MLVVHPAVAPASTLAPTLRVGGKPGFVVTDMTDVDQFEPIEPLPISSFYLVHGLSRGDDLAATRSGFSCTLARDNA